MQYHGKSIDTFEDAVTMLFLNRGYDIFPHIDCISLRCFVFQVNKQDWKNWLVPVMDHKSAVNRLFSFCGLMEYMKLECEKDALWKMMEYGCLVGPVSERKPYGIYSLYYDGYKKYLYVCGKKNGLFVVHDPDGFPMRLLKKEDFENYYDLSRAIAVTLEEGGNLIKEIDYLQVLRAGLNYRKKIENKESIDAWSWVICGKVNRFQNISVVNGLYNYLLQICKIICLSENMGSSWSSEMDKLNMVIKELYRCVVLGDIKQFCQLKEEIFIGLEKIAGLRAEVE